MTLDIAVTCENLQNYPFLGYFLTRFTVQQITLWCPTEMCAILLFNYLSLSYFFLVLTSAITNLTNTTSILHDFP